ncbi:MAG: YeeE/YedE family protein, partial [Robiginitalea sp.]
MDLIMQPWPWYVSGAAIALVMLLLLLIGKNFGM